MRTPALTHQSAAVYLGNCLDVLAEMPDNSVDAIVTDPPYGLGFMGKTWDDLPPGVDWARECLRVLKPGGHLIAFGGSRTWHRLAVAVEDAGFEIRDSIAWLYGSGFPKSLDVSKAIDKTRDDRDDILRVTTWLAEHAEARGITRADVDAHMGTSDMGGWWLSRLRHRCQVPRWEQWLRLRELIGFGDELDADVWRLNGRKGTPGEAWYERPPADYTTGVGMSRSWTDGKGWNGNDARGGGGVTPAAQQWNGWGTALKPAFEPIVVGRKPLVGTVAANVLAHGTGALNIDACRTATDDNTGRTRTTALGVMNDAGRWPTNVVLDDAVAAELDEQSGASRFFPVFRYQAKAPSKERPRVNGIAHPTVKPLALMRWLVRLVTPAGGTVLDTFAGSGATIEAAILEGFHAIGIEREETYLPLIRVRLHRVSGEEDAA